MSIDSMGFALFSTGVLKYVVAESNFLAEEFTDSKQVGEHIKKGDITAFCTGTGGDFILWFLSGYLDSHTEKEFPVHGEELMYWLTEGELETVQSGPEKQPFGIHGWLGMDMSFYSNTSDNMAVIMDCGELEVLYGAASDAIQYGIIGLPGHVS